MAENGNPSAHAPYQEFFRPSEVVLVLKPNDPGGLAGKSSVDAAELEPFLKNLPESVLLYDSSQDQDPLWVKRHPSLIVRRRTGENGKGVEVRVLHTARLEEWQAPGEGGAGESAGAVAGGQASIVAVATAVNTLNKAGENIQGGNFQLDSASPNWLTMPFQSG